MQKLMVLRTTACLAISVGLSGCGAGAEDLQTIDPIAATAFFEETNLAWDSADSIPTTGTASMVGNILLVQGDPEFATEAALGDLTLEVNFTGSSVTGEATNFNIFEDVGTEENPDLIFVESASGTLEVDGSTANFGGAALMGATLIGDLTLFGGDVVSVDNTMSGEFRNADG
jgi:hypothetical protein